MPTELQPRLFKYCHFEASLILLCIRWYFRVDRNPSYPKAVNKLKKKGILPKECKLRPGKYLNNLIEWDHRFIKRGVQPGIGFWSFETA